MADQGASKDSFRNRDELFALALEAGGVGIWDWDIPAGRVVWDDRLYGFFGIAPGSFDGRLETFSSFVHPEDRERVNQLIQTCVQNVSPYAAEMRILRPDGEQRTLFTNGRVLADADGKPYRMVGATIDITDTKRVESNLRISEARLTYAIEAANDGFWDWDLATGYCYLSPQWKAIIGYADDELRNHIDIWKDLLHPDDAAQAMANVQRHLSGETPYYRSEFRMRHKDGSWRYILSRGRAWRDAQGRPLWLAGAHTDLTELKRTEAELERRVEERTRELQLSQTALLQSQKLEAVGRLAGGVAHDFNNLLTGIGGACEEVRDSLPPNDERRAVLDEVIANTERAFQLTRQLLAFGRRQVAQRRSLDLNAVVREMEPLLRRLTGEDIDLRFEYSSSPPVFADPALMGQVVMNLVVNARESMPAGGPIQVKTGTETDGRGDWAFLSVQDAGAGIDEETRAHIFEPFFSTKKEGTGLGLATVYGIVTQSDGDVSVASRPGAGSTFTVRLPRYHAAPEGPAPSKAAPGDGEGETILVVEDEPIVRRVVTQRLKKAGYRIYDAGGGDEVKRLLPTLSRVDLLLTDVVMPGMNGVQVAALVHDSFPSMSVLYMSGYPQAILSDKGVLKPDVTLIEKSNLSRDLLSTLRRLLHSRSSGKPIEK